MELDMNDVMYNGDYIIGINKDFTLKIRSGEIRMDKLGTGNGFPLPYLKDVKYTGKMVGRHHKVLGGKSYEATAELKNVWYKTYEGNSRVDIIYVNDWSSWNLHN